MTYINNTWRNKAPDTIKDFKFKNLKKLYNKLKGLPIVEGLNIDRDLTYLSFEDLTQSTEHMYIRFITQSHDDISNLIEIFDKLNKHEGLFEDNEVIDGVAYHVLFIIPTQGLLSEVISEIRTNMPEHKTITIKIASISPTIDDRLFDYEFKIDKENNLICNRKFDFTNFKDNIVKYNFMVYLYLFGHANRNVYRENSPKVVIEQNDNKPKDVDEYDKRSSKRNHNYYHIKQLPIIR